MTDAPRTATLATANLFFQDEIALRRDVALTLGAKLEYDTLAPVATMVARASSEAGRPFLSPLTTTPPPRRPSPRCGPTTPP